MVRYDENGDCTRCGLPGSGWVADGVCRCLDEEEQWTDEDEAALEDYEERKRRRIAEENEY